MDKRQLGRQDRNWVTFRAILANKEKRQEAKMLEALRNKT